MWNSNELRNWKLRSCEQNAEPQRPTGACRHYNLRMVSTSIKKQAHVMWNAGHLYGWVEFPSHSIIPVEQSQERSLVEIANHNQRRFCNGSRDTMSHSLCSIVGQSTWNSRYWQNKYCQGLKSSLRKKLSQTVKSGFKWLIASINGMDRSE